MTLYRYLENRLESLIRYSNIYGLKKKSLERQIDESLSIYRQIRYMYPSRLWERAQTHADNMALRLMRITKQ